jgi:hypothetical protein
VIRLGGGEEEKEGAGIYKGGKCLAVESIDDHLEIPLSNDQSTKVRTTNSIQ